MWTTKLVRAAIGGVLVAGLMEGAALAQPIDKRTYFTFNVPVAIPGVTLPAGKYLFRVADTSSRNVVQVVSADGKTPYAMFFSYRAQRASAPAKPEIQFMETATGMPVAVHGWWYPGQRTGYEFVYPKEQARRLAMGTGRHVLTTVHETIVTLNTEAPELARVTPSGEETAVETPTAPSAPTGVTQVGELAPSSVTIVEFQQPPVQQARAALPKTGSATMSIALAGLALLLTAAVVRGVRLVRA